MKLLISIAIGIILDIMMVAPVREHMPLVICVLIGFVNGYVGLKITDDLGL